REVGADASKRGIEANLRDADKHVDNELDGRLYTLVLRADDPAVSRLLTGPTAVAFAREARSTWPAWGSELALRIDSSGPAVVPVIGTGQRVYGLFVVDREWQERPLTDTDVVSLTIFGRHAALILGQRDATERAVHAKRGEAWQDVSLVTSHKV